MTTDSSLDDAQARELVRWGLWLLVAFYVAFEITHAWVLDDAYITLRTVDNFVHGLGLRFNPEERVQSFTHPLWMFALSAVYFVTRESFFSTIVLAFATSLAAVTVVLRARGLRDVGYRPILFMAVLLGSKSFLDYSSSGLENPLTHLLLALFYTRWLDEQETPRLRSMTLLAALAFVNRMDTILFFLPALLLTLRDERARWQAALRELLVGAAPAIAWVLFSLLYYGMVVPNTAVAKVSGARVTQVERLQAGLSHVVDSLVNDPLTLIACGLAVAMAVASRRPRFVAAAVSIVLYLAYVLVAGGIGTHMSGRFFSAPLFLAGLTLALLAHHARVASGAVAVVVAWMVGSPVSPLHVGFNSYPRPTADRGVSDIRHLVEEEGASLLNIVPGESMPRHPWYKAGLELRESDERVHIGGVGGVWAMGYGAFAAGPDHFIIDKAGLTDPLIARIPLPVEGGFRPGHFIREVPDGYAESVIDGTNRIEDPQLKDYYDVLLVMTRAPLFSWERLRTIAAFNLGRYEPLLEAYVKRHKLRPR